MNIRIKKAALFICLSIPLLVYAQKESYLGVLPKISVSKSLNNDFSLCFEAESEQLFFSNEDSKFDYKYDLTDLSVLASKKTGACSKITAGYLLRFREKEYIHRFIQQYSYKSELENLRISHRLAAEQHLKSTEFYRIRLRYRLTGEIPLTGDRVDKREAYLKLSNEYLNSFGKDGKYDLEIRFYVFYGFVIFNQDIEIGIHNRTSSFIDGGYKNKLFFGINWNYAF